MNLDSGELKVFRLENEAESGLMPKLTESLIESCCYAERTVGFSRFYNAKQADMQVDILVRIHRVYSIRTGDRVRLYPYSHPSPDLPYLVIQIQQANDDDTHLPVTDLSLRIMTKSEADNATEQT